MSKALVDTVKLQQAVARLKLWVWLSRILAEEAEQEE